MSQTPSLVWFRNDLRLSDHPALTEAFLASAPIIPIFIWAPEEEDLGVGGASRWWLHQSLSALMNHLEQKGSRLIIREGESRLELEKLIEETGATRVFWNRRYEPRIIKRDTSIKSTLSAKGIIVSSSKSALLFEPWQLQTTTKNPYQVFTRFWEKAQQQLSNEPVFPEPTSLPAPTSWPHSLELNDLKLEPQLAWAEGFKKVWRPGEEGARLELTRFIREGLSTYPERRDIPAETGTSKLSPHLHFGEIGIRSVHNKIRHAALNNKKPGIVRGSDIYLKELGWREFAHHLIYHFPHTVHEPLHKEFAHFPWEKDRQALKAWQKGLTGYPIVDAGMRELWTTGWMHNRVRMIVASFLVKDLRLPWQQGAEWFWDTLVDADIANNTLGWQWSAGCGADAAPYFRIFNPTLQAERFDAEGRYVRTWVPELSKLPNKWIHQPWMAPKDVLEQAHIVLGKTYPAPVVDHGEARQKALQALQQMKRK